VFFADLGQIWAKMTDFALTLAKASLLLFLLLHSLGLMPCRIIQLRRSTRRFC